MSLDNIESDAQMENHAGGMSRYNIEGRRLIPEMYRIMLMCEIYDTVRGEGDDVT